MHAYIREGHLWLSLKNVKIKDMSLRRRKDVVKIIMMTLDMVYGGNIAFTQADRKQAAIYWEQRRKIAESIRDSEEKVRDDNYHKRFMERAFPTFYKPSSPNERPEFMEPEVKITKKNITKAFSDIKL